MRPIPICFVVALHDDGETAHELVVHAIVDAREPLSWFATRVVTTDGVCALEPEILNLIPLGELNELVEAELVERDTEACRWEARP